MKFFILLLFPTFTYCKEAQQPNVQSLHSLPSTIVIGQGQHEQPAFYALNQNGQVTEVNTNFISSAISIGITEAKKQLAI